MPIIQVIKLKIKNMKKINHNQSGIVHHIGLFIVLVLVAGIVGFAGMRVWQQRQSAKAASWDQIAYNFMNPGELRVYACRIDDTYAKVFIKNTSSYELSLSDGITTRTIKASSEAGPFTSKWSGIISWNNIVSINYSLADTVALNSYC